MMQTDARWALVQLVMQLTVASRPHVADALTHTATEFGNN